jgi:hypothetical protein
MNTFEVSGKDIIYVEEKKLISRRDKSYLSRMTNVTEASGIWVLLPNRLKAEMVSYEQFNSELGSPTWNALFNTCIR